MARKGFEIIEHVRSLKQSAVARKLLKGTGATTKLFESVDHLEEDEESLEETTEYGYDAKQEVGHDAKQGKQKPMQSIDDPKDGTAAAPNVVKKGGNKHKETGMLEEEEELEEMTTYGYDAKQEVGHEKRQGKQKGVQKIDTHAKGAGSADPGLRKKGPNKHKEDGMLEEVEELEETEELEERWDYTPDHRNRARPQAPHLNEATEKLLKTIHELRKRGKK